MVPVGADGRCDGWFADGCRTGARIGQRAAVVMSLIQPAELNGHDPYQYLEAVLTRL
jgi:hypothetical protein